MSVNFRLTLNTEIIQTNTNIPKEKEMNVPKEIGKLLRKHRESLLRAEMELFMFYGFSPELAKAVSQEYINYTEHWDDRGRFRLAVNVFTFMIAWSYATASDPALMLAIGYWIIIGFSLLGYLITITVRNHYLHACLEFQKSTGKDRPVGYFLSYWLQNKNNADFINMCFRHKYRTPNVLVALLRFSCFIGTLCASILLGYWPMSVGLAVLYIYKYYQYYQLLVHTARCLNILRQARSEALQQSNVIEMHFVLQ